ncbi:MAG TPA: AarF/UbiB family protein [Pyrinomonadaceae bacterium]|nr:AarF/UbiB family protein [Pyrinomonadaceae bacterium]
MITSVHQSAPTTSLKQRRQEVEQCLAMWLRRRPLGLTTPSVSFEGNHIGRLRAALEELGPVFCAFGLYLSTRVDLLEANDCLELASLPDGGEESSPAAIRRLVNQELGLSLEDVYLEFEERPFASGLFHQQHHASLHDGQAVVVKILHPEVEESLYYDVELLHLLKGPLDGTNLTASQIESAIDAFRLSLRHRIDLSLQAVSLAMIAQDADAFGILRAPLVHPQSSTSKVLTIEDLPGDSIDALLKSIPDANGCETEIEEEERYTVARRLCVAWLKQALLGNIFPAEPFPANVTVLPNNQIAFVDGCFADLTAEAKANLWDYLVAVVNEDPDLACSCLLRELESDKRSGSENALRQAFRQIVPFRDNELNHDLENINLAEHLFLHWRYAGKANYWPRPHLSSFYRGLFIISSITQRLAPTRDALKDALQDVRVLAGMEKFREKLTIKEFGEQMDKYFGMMIDFPQKLDQTLTLLAEGNARLRLSVAQPAQRVQKKTPPAIMALLFATAIMILLAPYVKHYLADAWSQSLKALVFLLWAVMLLRIANRS